MSSDKMDMKFRSNSVETAPVGNEVLQGQISKNKTIVLVSSSANNNLNAENNPQPRLEDILGNNVNFFIFWVKFGKYNLQLAQLGTMTKGLYRKINQPTKRLLEQLKNPSENNSVEEYQGFQDLDFKREMEGYDLNRFFDSLDDDLWQGSEGSSIEGKMTLETAVSPLVEAFLHIQIGDINWGKRNILWVKEYMILVKKKYPLLCPDYALGIKYLCTLLKLQIFAKEGYLVTDSIIQKSQSTRYEDLADKGKAIVWLARWLFLEVVETENRNIILSTENLKMICNLDTRNWVWPHILATRMRLKRSITIELIPFVDQLLEEEILFGRGWTVNESMRPYAYGIFADLVHHVRENLTLRILNRAVIFFSCRIQDESLPLSIHTMCCKLLSNLVESIQQKSVSEGVNGCEIFMYMLDVLVYKLKVIAKIHIPRLLKSEKESATTSVPSQPEDGVKAGATDELLTKQLTNEEKPKEESRRFCSLLPVHNCAVTDCRNLVKTIVATIKDISWGIASFKVSRSGQETNKIFLSYPQLSVKEAELYGKLIKWGLKALDIFKIKVPTMSINGQVIAQGKILTQDSDNSKEDKKAFEHFAAAFMGLNNYSFRELWGANVDLLVEGIGENECLKTVITHLLSNPMTSISLCTILIGYLLKKMPEMGDGKVKNGLYLQIFKIVFGSVRLFKENEPMLCPHLKDIVNRSMEYAMTAKDPYNYFLLLRALFNSIGGGDHEMLYQEFLLLLPNLFQGLFFLHGGIHKRHLSEVIIELFLDVPIRMTRVFPYLPLLVHPLICSLKGPPTLVTKGLRSLERCVDIFLPEFFHANLEPVRGELVEALTRIRKSENASLVASVERIVKKMGELGRKMILEHKKFPVAEDASIMVPRLTLYFNGQSAPINFHIDKVTEVALKTLRSTNPNMNLFYKKEAWQFLKGFLLKSLMVEQDQFIRNKIILDEEMRKCEIESSPIQTFTDGNNEKCRSSLIKGIAAVFVALSIKELARDAYIFLVPFIRHLALVILAEQCGPIIGRAHNKMDPYVLFDAMAQVLTYEERDLKRYVFVALSILMNSVINVVGTKNRACSLPMIGYLTSKMLDLCYERASYTKVNGCEMVKFLLEKMSMGWALCNHLGIVRAMQFVLADVSGVICVGALDLARWNLNCLIQTCATAASSGGAMEILKGKSVEGMTKEFVNLLSSPIGNVRKESIKGLELLGGYLCKSVSSLLEPHENALKEWIPPKKILTLPIPNQLGLLEAIAFCLGNRSQLSLPDLNSEDFRIFIYDIISVCNPKISDNGDVAICPEVKMEMLRVIALISNFNYEDNVTDNVSRLSKERIFNLFLDIIGVENSDLATCAFECVQKFMEGHSVGLEMARAAMTRLQIENNRRPVNSIPMMRQIIFMCQLFPGLCNQKMADKLFGILKRFLEGSVSTYRKMPARHGVYDLNSAVQTLSFFSRLPVSSRKTVERVIIVCLDAEKELLLGNNSPLRLPLMKYLLKQSYEYLELVFSLPYIKNEEWNRFFFFFLQQESAGDLRQSVAGKPERIIKHLAIQNCLAPMSTESNPEPNIIQYLTIKTLSTLNKFGQDWFLIGPDGTEIVTALKNLWEIVVYQAHNCLSLSLQNSDSQSNRFQVGRWKKVRMIAHLLLSYYKRNRGDIFLLFKLLLVFTGKVVPQFQFLKDYLENHVTAFCVQWKRKAFCAFVNVFEENGYPDDLKAKIIQFILIPCIKYSFENGQGEELIVGYNPSSTLVGCFLAKIIDPCNQNGISDVVRIPLYQLTGLFVEHASAYLRDVPGSQMKLRRLVKFACPLSMKFTPTCVDSISKYYGHLLLCHIIAKFPISRRIVCLVLQSLLKASGLEAKTVVRQALDILLPVLSEKILQGQEILFQFTKQSLSEEGHNLSVLQLIVRHWKVYYPVRHSLIFEMVRGMQRLGMNPISTFDHRKLAVEMAQIVIKWELERKRIVREEEMAEQQPVAPKTNLGQEETSEQPPEKKIKLAENVAGKTTCLGKTFTDAVVNFLMRFACRLNDANQVAGCSGDILPNRCVSLVNLVLKSHVWAETDLDLSWLDALFETVDKAEFNVSNICTALELLTTIIVRFPKKYVQEHMKMLQRGISICMKSHIQRVVLNVHLFLKELTALFPIEAPTGPNGDSSAQKYKELEVLYTNVRKVINFGLNIYDRRGDLRSLYRGLMILKSVCCNNEDYINGFIPQLINVFHRLTKAHLECTPNAACVPELLLSVLHLVKKRIDIMDVELRKQLIDRSLVELLVKSTDMKVIMEIITFLDEWIRNNNYDPLILQDKSILLGKLMQIVEKRFPGDNPLTAKFFDIVYFVYTDEIRGYERLAEKLRPAFLSALRSTNPQIREKFSTLFHESLSEKLHHRVMYILNYPNWRTVVVGQQSHYWIKQWMELLLFTIKDEHVELSPRKIIIPGVANNVNTTDPAHKKNFLDSINPDINNAEIFDHEIELVQKIEADVENFLKNDKKNEEMILIAKMEDAFLNNGWNDPSHPIVNTKAILAKETEFRNMISQVEIKTLVHAISQLVHLDNYLAEHLWVMFFPRIWKIFSSNQHTAIASEVVQFIQKWKLNQNNLCRSFSLFLMTLSSKCDPTVTIPPLEDVIAELQSAGTRTVNPLTGSNTSTPTRRTLNPLTMSNVSTPTRLTLNPLIGSNSNSSTPSRLTLNSLIGSNSNSSTPSRLTLNSLMGSNTSTPSRN